MNTTRRQITQPAAWWDAFEDQARSEGLTVSQWLGKLGFEQLPRKVRRTLPDRPRRGKPSQHKGE